MTVAEASYANAKQGTFKKHIRWLLIAVLFISFVVGSLFLAIRLLHPRLIYKPMLHKGVISEESLLKNAPTFLELEPVWITAKDGVELRAYFFRHPDSMLGKKMPALLYFHGNKGDLKSVFESVAVVQRGMPVNILLPSYRSYGYSQPARLSQKGVRLDSEAALDYLLTRPEVNEKVLLYGHSLGGAVALHLLSLRWPSFERVLIENTFRSIPMMAAHAAPWLKWATFLVTDRWENDRIVGMLPDLAEKAMKEGNKLPDIAFVAGAKDDVVPPEHMNYLWNSLQKIKTVDPRVELGKLSYDQCRHSCISELSYQTDIASFLAIP